MPSVLTHRKYTMGAFLHWPLQYVQHLDPKSYISATNLVNLQACFAGALFGVDAGIIGGVLVMPDFKRYAVALSTHILRRSEGKNKLTFAKTESLVLTNAPQVPPPICPATSSLLCKQALLQELWSVAPSPIDGGGSLRCLLSPSRA